MNAGIGQARPSRRTGARFFLLLATCSLAALAFSARPAFAYVRYITEDGKPFQWQQTCIQVTGYPNQNDFPDMTADQVQTAATGAADAWSSAGLACTYLSIDVALSSAPAPTASADKKNSLIFRHKDWCSPSDSAWTCSYDPAALAITSVFVQRSTGRIQEADIEVNDRWFNWTDLELFPADKSKQDLQNALTHEMGHLIGLDHTCFMAVGNLVRPNDNQGNPVPDCSSAPPEVRATTMFASAVPGDLSKRTLEPDDQQAVCDIYPLARDPAYCPTDSTGSTGTGDSGSGGLLSKGGCALAAGDGLPSNGGAPVVAATMVAMVLRHRQGRRAGRAPR